MLAAPVAAGTGIGPAFESAKEALKGAREALDAAQKALDDGIKVVNFARLHLLQVDVSGKGETKEEFETVKAKVIGDLDTKMVPIRKDCTDA